MFKLHELRDGDRRQALILPLHMCNLNQWSPFSNSQSAIRAEGFEMFQLKPVHLNMNNTQGRVHYDNSLQLHKISAYLSPLLLECSGEECSTSEGALNLRAALTLDCHFSPSSPSLV